MDQISNAIQDRNSLIKSKIDLVWKGLSTPTFSGFKLDNRYRYKGLSISIENSKGSVRKWTDLQGKEGKTKMIYDYGYIRRTVGNDGDHIDCYVNKSNDSDKVFVVHQLDPKTGKFDEDKVMLGFDSSSDAKAAYLKHYTSSKFFGSMTEIAIKEFKKKVIGKVVKKIK